MQLPKLTPLQSRLLVSVIATCLLVIIWISFQPHHLVYAAQLDAALPPGLYAYDEAPAPSVDDAHILDLDLDSNANWKGEGSSYKPEFGYFERSIIGRAADGVNSLTNNVKYPLDIKPGDTANFVFGKEEVNGEKGGPGVGLPSPLDGPRLAVDELVEDVEDIEDTESRAKRQTGNRVYISINTCRQPSANGTATSEPPPQLTLYVSTSVRNQKPGPDADEDLATDPVPLDSGFANFSVETSSDVFIGVSAPAVDNNWDGNWHFEVAASTDAFYHDTKEEAFLFLVDTDSSSALFITPNLTNEDASAETNQKWMDMPMPFTMYAFAEGNNGRQGLEKSACGLKEQFNKANIKVDGGMINRTAGSLPKAQFHIQNLNASTKYYGFVALNGNGTTDGLDVPGNAVVRGGGQVWRQFSWRTKSDGNCQVIFNLTFCSSVAYSVPANPTKFSAAVLAQLYDNRARDLYDNFTKSLAQIACNTTGTAQYSLARNCSDCARDYKDWLCSVLMPRCEDYSATDDFLIPRNVNAPFFNDTRVVANDTRLRTFDMSRNPMIDDVIQPGPYKEILPCDTLCNDIVRSCPAQLGFSCPEGQGRSRSYGVRKDNASVITCSFPGAVKDLNVFQGRAGSMMASTSVLSIVVATLTIWMVL